VRYDETEKKKKKKRVVFFAGGRGGGRRLFFRAGFSPPHTTGSPLTTIPRPPSPHTQPQRTNKQTGRSAFGGLHFGEVYQTVAIEGRRPPPPAGAPEGYSLLMRACWAADPAERPSFAAVVPCLDLLQREAAAAAGMAPLPVPVAALPAPPPRGALPPPASTSPAPIAERREEEEAEQRRQMVRGPAGAAARGTGGVVSGPATGGAVGVSGGLADRASSLLHVKDL
jgi:hypothetical protein